MVLDLLYSTLKRESEPINRALNHSLSQLPASVQPVAKHIFEAGGKRLRPFLAVICARMLGYENAAIYTLASSLEMLHAATLLHDDILDDAATRRGRAAAHTIFGSKVTILAGDALLALGNSIVAEFDMPALCACYSRATRETAAGEIMEIESLRFPDLDPSRYLEIARGKTACLISQACVMGATVAKAPPEAIAACLQYGDNVGLAFQLVDDALDFAPTSRTGKPRGGDLREGKMTPPIRLYRASLESAERANFDANFRQGTFTDVEIGQLAEKIAPFAGESLNLADECVAEAMNCLGAFPPGEYRKLLEEIALYVRARPN